MNFENYFPLWNDLNTAQKKIISDNLITRDVKKGTIIHNGNLDCTGLLLVKTGQLRTYILSDEGREITLYRLFDMDICLLSASCIIRSIQFEVTIEAEKDTDLWIIPAEIYKGIIWRLKAGCCPARNWLLGFKSWVLMAQARSCL